MTDPPARAGPPDHPAGAGHGQGHGDAGHTQGHGDAGHTQGHGDAGQRGGHTHGVRAGADGRWLGGALALIVAFMAAEVTAGLVAGSLALLSDAAHMLTDAASIGLAIATMRLAARPAAGGFTYGLKRTEILSAQANGLTLLLLSAWLTVEAVRRLLSPPAVAGGLVLLTAIVGVALNLAATWMISKANTESLNVKGAFQHILTDVYAFAATAVAGLVILLTGFARADAIASLIVVALMVRAGAGLVAQSGRIFLEAAPPGLRPEEIGQAMAALPPVREVHDLHVWEITSGMTAASAHVLVAEGEDCHAVRGDLERLLSGAYHIDHTTLQVDHAPRDVLAIGRPGEARRNASAARRGDSDAAHDGPR